MSAWPRLFPLLGTLLSVLLAFDLLSIALTPVLIPTRPADVAIVLGNTVLRDGTPSPRLQARLNRALRLYQAGAVHQIFVSGGTEAGSPPRSEAAAMARYLERHGVPSETILLDSNGNTTAATARNAATMLGTGKRVIVVSQWFHLCRARLALQQQGFRQVAVAAPRYIGVRDLYSLAREIVALPVYALRPRR